MWAWWIEDVGIANSCCGEWIHSGWLGGGSRMDGGWLGWLDGGQGGLDGWMEGWSGWRGVVGWLDPGGLAGWGGGGWM